MQIYNQTFETNVDIPIRYTYVPDSLIFNDTLPSQIKVKVKDFGYNMFRYHLKKNDTILLDVSPITNISSGNSRILQGALLEAYLRKILPQSASIINYDPVRISFNYSLLKSRRIPVIFDGQINLSPGYFLNGDIRIFPDSITAYGSLADLNKLIYAYTTSDTVNKMESNSTLSYNLIENANIKLVPNRVNIDVPIEAYTQKKVDVPIECFNLPSNLSVKFFPSRVSLSFMIGVSMVDSISSDDFSVGIDYEGIKDSRSASVPVRITSSPTHAQNLTINPPNVEFIFEYNNTPQ